jgi:hypothetical protein
LLFDRPIILIFELLIIIELLNILFPFIIFTVHFHQGSLVEIVSHEAGVVVINRFLFFLRNKWFLPLFLLYFFTLEIWKVGTCLISALCKIRHALVSLVLELGIINIIAIYHLSLQYLCIPLFVLLFILKLYFLQFFWPFQLLFMFL